MGAGVVNMMSLSTRFADGCRHLGHLARDNYFGELYYARARSVRRNGIPAWNLGFIQKGGGAFRDIGVHALDAVWWVLGAPKPLYVIGTAGAKFGPYGRGYGFNREYPKEIFQQFEADAKLHPLTAYRCDDEKEEDITLDPPKKMDAWDRIADHFITCILDGIDCEAPLKHGLMVQRMMEGLLRSAETNQPVSLEIGV